MRGIVTSALAISAKYSVLLTTHFLIRLPIYEPGLQAIVAQRINKNLFFTTDVASAVQEAELIFIAVNTPTKETGAHVRTFAFVLTQNSNIFVTS